MRYIGLILTLALALTACGKDSQVGKPIMTRDDKAMSCEEILLDINDAEFLRSQAQDNKGLNFRNIVWPLGYPSTVSSANEAIKITSERIDYLSNIYRIKRCQPPLKGDEQ